MKTQKNNKLIAEFMKVDQVDIDTWLETNSTLQYHTSWNWLMPVVEKISYKAYVSIETRGTTIELKGKIISNVTGRENKPTMINNTYKAVVTFIQWYNEKNEMYNPYCKKYHDSEAIPDEDGKCSLCGDDCVDQEPIMGSFPKNG